MKLWIIWIIFCALPVWAEDFTVDGVTYQDVTWGSVHGTSISVTHRSGVASIPVAKLPADIQQRLGLDPAKLAQQQAAERQRAAEQEKKWLDLGYVKRHGQWVSPAEMGKYLDAKATAQQLQPLVESAGTTNSLKADIDELGRDTGTGAIEAKRATLLSLQKYGHESYQPAIGELLAACDGAFKLREALVQDTADKRNAAERFQAANAALRGYPARNAQEAANIQALRQKAIDAEAFYQRLDKLREEALRHCQTGLDLKARADAAPVRAKP